jgi:hypothetical protein
MIPTVIDAPALSRPLCDGGPMGDLRKGTRQPQDCGTSIITEDQLGSGLQEIFTLQGTAN